MSSRRRREDRAHVQGLVAAGKTDAAVDAIVSIIEPLDEEMDSVDLSPDAIAAWLAEGPK